MLNTVVSKIGFETLCRSIHIFMYFLRNQVKILISKYYYFVDLHCPGLVQPESEDKRIFSASWVKDTGINQCLRYLPNWLNLQEERKADKDSIDQVPETIEDIRERNEKVDMPD